MGIKTVQKNGKEIQIFHSEDHLVEDTWVEIISGPLSRQLNNDAPQIKVVLPDDMLVSWMHKIGKPK